MRYLNAAFALSLLMAASPTLALAESPSVVPVPEQKLPPCDPTATYNRDNKHPQADKAIDRIGKANLSPKRLIGWGLILLALGMSTIGWLWMQVAGRRGLTLGQIGWRGLIAVGFVAVGLLILWQAVPLVLF